MFAGSYHGKQAHEADLDDVIQRAKDVGCEKFMVTGSDLVESEEAIKIARKYRESPSGFRLQHTIDQLGYSRLLLCHSGCAPLPSQNVR